jgi:hypothetical protein
LQPNITLESVSENYLLTQPVENKKPHHFRQGSYIFNGYLVILGMVHDFQCIAAIETYESYKGRFIYLPLYD